MDRKLGSTGAKTLKILDGKSVDKVVQILAKSNSIEYVQPDYILQASNITEPLYSQEWGLKNIGKTSMDYLVSLEYRR